MRGVGAATVLGAAETVVGLTDSFKTVGDKHGLYAPNPRPRLRQVPRPLRRPGLRIAPSGTPNP